MNDQVANVTNRLAGQWLVYDKVEERDVTVSWLVPIGDGHPDGGYWPVHASPSTAFDTLCGKRMAGVQRRRRYIPVAQQCEDCAAFLRAHGRLV